MGRFQKKIKKYERHLLLGLVILLLVSFSVTGAIECSQGGTAEDWGGEFNVSPSTRETLASDSFQKLWYTRLPFYRASAGPLTLKYRPDMYGVQPQGDTWAASWMHAMPVAAARQAGYRCGEAYELPTAIRTAVQGALGGIEFNDATYDKFLRDYYRAGTTNFQDTIREIVIKDAFLRPLIETARYGIPYDEAYEAWKKLLPRVELEYVALRGEDFALAARQQETTRSRISAQVDLLQQVSNTARMLDGTRARLDMDRARRVEAEIQRLVGEGKTADEAKTAAEAAVGWPEKLADLDDPAPQDAWGEPVRYAADGETFTLVSAGPDRAFDSSDDLTLDTVAQVKTRAALRQVGDALQRWYQATKAWPETIDAMRAAPAEGKLAPLKGPAKDGWDRDLVLAAGAEGAAPRLYSAGPDGEEGTPDDVASLVSTDAVIVPPGIAFIPFLAEQDQDAWERPMRVDLTAPQSWSWTVTSAGEDGSFGTDDDLDTGNRGDLDRFYRRQEVQEEFAEPARREFEGLYLHLPLMPDEALKTLWDQYESLRPEEMPAFDYWMQMGDMVYQVDDPADAENGHGVEQIRVIYPDAPLTLVPEASIFGEVPEALLNANDPNMVAYREKGWRPVLLRERFIERVLNDLLTRARDSQRAVQAWEAKQEALDAWTEKKAAFDKGEGEDPGEKPEEPGEKPEALTFQGLFETELASVHPAEGETPWIGFYRTDGALERSAWETLKDFGGIDFSEGLRRLKEDGQYAAIPTVLRDTHTRAILRNLVNHPRRYRELDEVYDDVFERYLVGKRLEVAEQRLLDLRGRVTKASITTSPKPAGEDEGEEAPDRDPGAPWADTLKTWGEELGVPFVQESTGWFVGSRPPAAREPGDDVPAEEQAFLARRDFVRSIGYESIRAATAKDHELTPGTMGREVLTDDATDGTDAVYLVRLKAFRYPPEEAFSPRAYADYLTSEIIGRGLPKGGLGMGAAAGGERVDIGVLTKGVQDFFADFKVMSKNFGLDPHKVPEREGSSR